MDLLIDKFMFITYLENCLIKTKTTNICNLIQIFENESNKFLLTESMISRIENEIKEKPALLYDFQSFIKHLSDSKRFLIQNIKESTEEGEIIKVFNNNLVNEQLFVFIKESNNFYNALSHRCCFWNNIAKPNKDWIIFYLVSIGQISVRYLDFGSDKQIEEFFENYFKLSFSNKNISILDSYCNYYGLTLFNPIRNNGHKVSVYTSSFKKKEVEKTQLRKSIKDHFNKTTKVKFSSDKTLIHERTIIHGDFVLEVNHDFAEIKRKNKNWKIDITLDSLIKLENENKFESYN